MKALILAFSLFSLSPVFSQEAPEAEPVFDHSVGAWVNIHRGRRDILGVVVQQFPDNLHSRIDYEGKHPAMVIYVFKTLDIHQIAFDPDGAIKDAFWFKIQEGDPILERMTEL